MMCIILCYVSYIFGVFFKDISHHINFNKEFGKINDENFYRENLPKRREQEKNIFFLQAFECSGRVTFMHPKKCLFKNLLLHVTFHDNYN